MASLIGYSSLARPIRDQVLALDRSLDYPSAPGLRNNRAVHWTENCGGFAAGKAEALRGEENFQTRQGKEREGKKRDEERRQKRYNQWI